MGVVYHANYLVYFEQGRTELIRACGVSYADIEALGVRLPVVEAHVEHTGPARYDDVLLLQTRITLVSAVRIRFDYRLCLERDGKLLATGYTVLASVNFAGRPQRLPESVRRAFEGSS
jgi:acyl-CoA thioester hydrolase